MGMFDTVMVSMYCPLCGEFERFDAQTKDLDSLMFTYHALSKDWDESKSEKKFREGLPVFKKFPLDREAEVWKDQAERIEAEATISEEYQDKLNFVNVITDCSHCKKYFEGKVVIKDGKLFGEIYDCIIIKEKRDENWIIDASE